MKIFITSYCDNLELEKAALLTLSTLRIGFPTVEDVTCLWAGGLESVREKAQAICEQNGIKFSNLYEGYTNDKIYSSLIECNFNDLILLDSDVIFWSECESFQPSENAAGRWIPGHFCKYTRSWTVQRVHPSFLWIKSVEKLRSDLLAAYTFKSRFTPYDPIAPVVIYSRIGMLFFDTLANLPVPVQHFDADMLDRYDHLFCGSFVNLVSAELLATHKAIYANPLIAKGIWRKQDEYFYGTSNSR